MSHTSKIFEEAPIKVQNRNGFDLSHLTCGTSKTGQLVPVLCKLLPPNSSFTLGANLEVSLPPLATPFYGRVDAIVEGFVIYLSQLYGGWKQFISNQQSTMFPQNQGAVEADGGFALPYFDLGAISSASTDVAGFRALMDTNDNIVEYLGARFNPAVGSTFNEYKCSLMPLLAYHLCWDTFYRNKNVTRTIFSVNSNIPFTIPDSVDQYPSPSFEASNFNKKNVSLIWHSFYTNSPLKDPAKYQLTSPALFGDTASLTFPDGISIFSTRQRNYSRDYFTAASVNPQQGRSSSLRFDVASEEGEAAFTIGSLRAANALQKFLETNNLSADYADMMRNRWGARPIDADFDEPYYLGRVVVPVYQHSIAQQQEMSGTSDRNPNPFVQQGSLGARGASGGMKGEGSICDKFTCTSWAYVMALFSLVPHAMYGYGLSRELTMTKLGDFPAPELQTIGNEAILSSEVYFSAAFPKGATFGYIPRYSRFKYIDDSVHGELRPGKSLESFVLQRRLSFADSSDIKLSTSFLEIPQNALDSVFSVSTDSMNLSCWYEIFFSFKVSMPLADFCIPTLGDIQDTHTQKTTIGGSKL